VIFLDPALFAGLGPDVGVFDGRWPVVEGTRVCLDPTPAGKTIVHDDGWWTWSELVTPEADYLDCFSFDWGGGALDGDGCFVAADPGVVQISMEAESCAYDDSPHFAAVDDFARLEVYVVEALTARIESAAERWAELFLAPTGRCSETPTACCSTARRWSGKRPASCPWCSCDATARGPSVLPSLLLPLGFAVYRRRRGGRTSAS